MLEGRRIYLKPGSKKPIVRYKQEDLDALFEKRQKGKPRQTAMEKAESLKLRPGLISDN